jgi:autotransporter-associated beta strand protein
MSAQTSRACAFALLTLALTAASARAEWWGATTGTSNDLTHSYSTNSNWSTNAPELTFNPNPALTGATALYFSADWTTTGLWTIAYTGNFPLTLQGGGKYGPGGNDVDPADHTVTLGGNVSMAVAGTGNQTITLGRSAAGSGLNIILGTGARTIGTVLGAGTLPDVQILGTISGGSGLGVYLIVAGVSGSTSPAGRLLLSNGNNSYALNTKVLAGTLLLGADATGLPGGTVLGSNPGAVFVGNTANTGQNAALLTYGPYTVSRNISVQSGDTGTVTLGGANTSGTAYFTGNITLGKGVTLQALGGSEVDFNGNIWSGVAAGVTIAGGGTVKMGGGNTYSGSTIVKAGSTARITGSIAQTSGVTIEPGAIMELAGAAGSPLAVTTPVTNDGSLLISQTAVAGHIGGDGSASVTASLTADSIVQNTLTLGAGVTVSIRATTAGAAPGNLSQVPEPGMWVLLIAGGACLPLLLRRRRTAERAALPGSRKVV